MGRNKPGKPRKQQEHWADDTEVAEGNPDLWIVSTRRRSDAGDEKTACLLTWGGLEWFADGADVMQTAVDIQTSAAYADVMEQLIRFGLEGPMVSQLIESMLGASFKGRTPAHGGMLGTAGTIGVVPAASSARKAGVVMLKRGSMTGSVSPAGAREMAGHWMEVAAGCGHDEVVQTALEDILGVSEDERLRAFFGYMMALRGVDAKDMAGFREVEGARLRMVMGMPPAPEPSVGG